MLMAKSTILAAAHYTDSLQERRSRNRPTNPMNQPWLLRESELFTHKTSLVASSQHASIWLHNNGTMVDARRAELGTF
eukprot:jgi/Botrbrau1/22773/Bobra.0132s0103.3